MDKEKKKKVKGNIVGFKRKIEVAEMKTLNSLDM
ncbi:MAG: hypothetical protein CM15mP40_14090 [Alphaproteobacteria bacterium]|nr:MAG: hypothetical protein CM15mP40_14090 [Alphaproteobacteria bacterium]